MLASNIVWLIKMYDGFCDITVISGMVVSTSAIQQIGQLFKSKLELMVLLCGRLLTGVWILSKFSGYFSQHTHQQLGSHVK